MALHVLPESGQSFHSVATCVYLLQFIRHNDSKDVHNVAILIIPLPMLHTGRSVYAMMLQPLSVCMVFVRMYGKASVFINIKN